jgi:hypothetical protein
LSSEFTHSRIGSGWAEAFKRENVNNSSYRVMMVEETKSDIGREPEERFEVIREDTNKDSFYSPNRLMMGGNAD